MSYSYIKKAKIGEGAYSTIYLAEQYEGENENKVIENAEGHFKQIVAIKQFKIMQDVKGIDINAIREIKALKLLRGPHILEMYDIFRYDFSLHIVLEYIPYTLENILKNNKIIILASDIKAWLIMLLKGIYEIHSKYFIHRDIKPNNILFKDGILKIADFGLTRKITNDNMTSNVVTRWYRAPELLLGCKNYSMAVDIWSIGCIMAELYLRVPFFAGDSDISQLDLIFRALGTPDEIYFKKITESLPIKFKKYPRSDLKQLFSAMSDDGMSLLLRMLDFDPAKRPTALEILKDKFFTNNPLPKDKDNVLKTIPI
ncbi:CMGC/CDK/CDK7 protein kinase [Anncaliia algerae PRA339]|uniref:[RNA-polymerase]-subunit kinase n=1 Tax=Anncaliia algerae PRA339 TaxID=1288291 RepID=A0A059F0G1_9MICR|nr:CMGC/CDK/CDK7 protein kinase [Anncaliia algerae PRA339]